MTEVHDFLAREFAPLTGCHWDGVDIARLPRDRLISIIGTLLGTWAVDAGLTRERLIHLVIAHGRQQRVWS